MTHKTHWPLSLAYGICSAFSLFLPVLLVRILPVSAFGSYKIFFLYLFVAQWLFFSLGIRNGLSYWAGSPSFGIQAIRSSWTLLILSSLLFPLLCCVFQKALCKTLGLTSIELSLLSWAAFASVLSCFYEEVLIASGRIYDGALFFVTFELTRTIGVLAAAYYTQSLMAIYSTFTGFVFLKLIAGIVLGWSESFTHPLVSLSMAKKVLSYVIPASGAATLLGLIGYSDQILLSHFFSPHQFAFYSIGCLSIPPLLMLEQSINRVLIPQISQEMDSSRFQNAAHLVRDAIEELGCYLIPAVFGLILFSSPIMHLLFTDKYLQSSMYLKLYGLYYLALMIPYDAVHRATGQGTWILKASALFLIFAVILGLLGVKYLGPKGALLALLSTQFSLRTYFFADARKRLYCAWRDLIPWPGMKRFCWVSTGLTAFCLAGRLLFAQDNYGDCRWLLSFGPIFFVVYIASVLPWRWRTKAQTTTVTNVMMVTQFLGIGGLEKTILNLTHGLLKSGKIKPFVFVYDEIAGGPHLYAAFESAGVHVELFKKKAGFSIQAVIQMVQFILKNQIQAVHTHDTNALIYGVFTKIGSLNRIKLIHTQHTFVHLAPHRKDKRFRHSLYEKLFTLFPDQLCAVSDSIKTRYGEVGVKTHRIQVIENGVPYPTQSSIPNRPAASHSSRSQLIESLPDPALRQRLKPFRESIWLICMARICPEKGQDHVLKVWQNLPLNDQRKCALLFIGPESQPKAVSQLMTEIQWTAEAERIHYLGATQDPDAWLRETHIFLSGSEFEGLPLGPLEALGSGRPALLSDIHGHRVLQEWAALFPILEPAEGAYQLSRIIADIEENETHYYEKLWQQAEQLRKGFGLSKMINDYSKNYDYSSL